MTVGEWTERPMIANRPALGLSPADPEPRTVYDRPTKDGQRLRAIIFGDGGRENPHLLRLECRKMDHGDLEVGVQEPGSARWPTLRELADAASLLPDGAVLELPKIVAGQEIPEPENFTRLDLPQVGMARGVGEAGPRIHRPGAGGGDGPPIRH